MSTRTNSHNDLEQAIAQGIDFLYAMQLPSGGFRMFRSTHPPLEQEYEPEQSPFPAALIANCLNFTKSEKAEEVVRKAIYFLASTMEEGGVWRYWTLTQGYVPPDLDDTACISFLLKRHGICLPDNTSMMLGNRDSRGLFYTWVLPRWRWTTHTSYWRIALRELLKLPQLYHLCKLNDCKPNDLDAVVNANILHYLGERPETRPIIQYLIHVIEEQAEETCDRWYGSRFSFYYFLSRNHAAGMRAFEQVGSPIVERIKSYAHPDGVIGNHILHAALAACALMDWKDHSTVLDHAIQAILRARGDNGGWQRFSVYYSGPTKKFAWGSDEVTTGFCLEALSRYRNLQS
ncbi:MAG TPA: hypothetical protein VNW97_21305 [Candidatus Saccharimonadales bacterium]|jgi:hypothetical protein|nr:hypothetical protein [Candidatus Saccharimonadales bacterium]